MLTDKDGYPKRGAVIVKRRAVSACASAILGLDKACPEAVDFRFVEALSIVPHHRQGFVQESERFLCSSRFPLRLGQSGKVMCMAYL